MGLTGRYDFVGIQKTVRRVVEILAAGTSWGAYVLAGPFKPVFDFIEDWIVNWLVNRGLIIIDIGAVSIDGKIDQAKLDAALNDAFTKMQVGRDKITPAEGAAIDQEVADAFDQAADLDATNTAPSDSVSDVPSNAFRAGDHSPVQR